MESWRLSRVLNVRIVSKILSDIGSNFDENEVIFSLFDFLSKNSKNLKKSQPLLTTRSLYIILVVVVGGVQMCITSSNPLLYKELSRFFMCITC